MLVAVTNQGVAAIVFAEKNPELINKSAAYRFRYLKDAESEEVMGTGMVLDTVNDKDKLTVKAGSNQFGWSGDGHDHGFVYYKPEDMLVCIAQSNRFDDSFAELVDEKHPVQKLDLKRFLKKQK